MDKLDKILQEQGDGFAPVDRDFIAGLLEQILYARYYGGADFPQGHPEYKEKVTCGYCYGDGTWSVECCNGSGGCSCNGREVFMGNCNVCKGTGYMKKDSDMSANSKAIAGYGYIGDGGTNALNVPKMYKAQPQQKD